MSSDATLHDTITRLLHRVRGGDKAAENQLFERVYDELRWMARRHLRNLGDQKHRDATSLVHEACARLIRREAIDANDRRHFFFLLGRAMRDVLVESIRAASAAKRGEGIGHVPQLDFVVDGQPSRVDFLDLHEALDALDRVDADAAKVVNLRYFSGLTIEETAEALGQPVAAVRGHWDYAKAWLSDRLSGGKH